MWARKFIAVATIKCYRDMLLGKTKVKQQDEVMDENDPNNKAKLKGRKETRKPTLV